MARSRKQKAAAPEMPAPKPAKSNVVSGMLTDMKEASKGMKDEHKTFSHVMYVLFLVSVTIAAYFTYQTFRGIASNPDFYGVLGLLMLGWAFLFWEFGHRVHVY